MFLRNNGRRAARRLFFEALESRAMLAGNVTAFAAGGSLFVRGDPASNQISIAQFDSDTYAVTGLNGTAVNGVPNGVFVSNRPVTANIDVDLLGGNDVALVGNAPQDLVNIATSLGFSAGLGTTATVVATLDSSLAAAAAPAQFSLPGSLIVKTGLGNDGVALIGDIGGVMSALLSDGDNQLGVQNSSFGVGAAVNAGTGNDTIRFEDGTTVNLALTATLGSGNNALSVSSSTVTGNVVYTGGIGTDSLTMVSTPVAGTVSVALGDGANNNVTIVSAPIGGGLVVTAGLGNDAVTVVSSTVGGTVVESLGNGSNATTFVSSPVAGSFVVSGGLGNDATTLVSNPVGGALSVVVGEGSNATTVVSSSIGLGLSYVGGSGNDAFVAVSSNVGGTASFVLGNGANAVTLVGATIAGNLAIIGGSDVENISLTDLIVSLNLSIVTANGNDIVHANNVDVGFNATIDTGAGTDTVRILNGSSVGNLFMAILGEGNDDLLEIKASTAALVGLDGGIGTGDTLDSDLNFLLPIPGTTVIYVIGFEVFV